MPIDGALEAQLAAAAERCGCELIHLEFKGGILRLVLDRPAGVSLADCEAVSRQVSPLLDVLDFGPGRYTLEVSSPGLDRELYGPRDYERFLGSLVRVTWEDDAGKRTATGRLEVFRPAGGGTAEVVDSQSGERYIIPLKNIRLARLEPEL